jgi:hypothetical protein
MSRWLKALAKAGLVELSEDEHENLKAREEAQSAEPVDGQDIDRILRETRELMNGSQHPEAEAQPGSGAPPPPPVPSAPPVEVVEGQDFSELYAGQIPESPFPAEKLLRVMDGLKAMDPGTRRAAVMAMDSADDEWTIGDPLIDAQRKIQLLQSRTASLSASITQAEAQAEADLKAQEEYKQQATTTIREQIADLEAMLEAELEKVADEKAGIHSALNEKRASCTREAARYEGEIDRLASLSTIFGDLVPKE